MSDSQVIPSNETNFTIYSQFDKMGEGLEYLAWHKSKHWTYCLKKRSHEVKQLKVNVYIIWGDYNKSVLLPF